MLYLLFSLLAYYMKRHSIHKKKVGGSEIQKRIGLDKDLHIPHIDQPISDRIRTDFLQPQIFVPQHMTPQCRPIFVPIDMEDPMLEGYPNIEPDPKGKHARYVAPVIDEPLGQHTSRVIYGQEQGDGPFGSTTPSQNQERKRQREKETKETEHQQHNEGLLGDYIRSFSLRHNSKDISDEEAIAMSYPLYRFDTRYQGGRKVKNSFKRGHKRCTKNNSRTRRIHKNIYR